MRPPDDNNFVGDEKAWVVGDRASAAAAAMSAVIVVGGAISFVGQSINMGSGGEDEFLSRCSCTYG